MRAHPRRTPGGNVDAGRISPGAILFTPFALVALWAIGYPWRTRDCRAGIEE